MALVLVSFDRLAIASGFRRPARQAQLPLSHHGMADIKGRSIGRRILSLGSPASGVAATSD
jgi:hypothetical protein